MSTSYKQLTIYSYLAVTAHSFALLRAEKAELLKIETKSSLPRLGEFVDLL